MTEPSTAGGALGIVVVNYASAALIEANLGALDLTGRPVRVVVVDNHSSAAEAESSRALTARHGWELVELPDNRGFGPACNAGAAAARALGCVTLLFLNPDAVVTPEVLDELRRHSLREPLAVISPRLVDSTGAVVFRGSWWHEADGRIRGAAGGARWTPTDPPVPGAHPWLTAACLVVHGDLFDRVGGFAESYFLYWEDVDLSHRCLAAGGSLVLREDLVAVHDEGGTQGRQRGRAKSAGYYRWNCRNRLLFAVRNLGRADVLRWIRATPAVSWEILLRGGRRQLVQQPALLRAAVAGSLAGLAVAARSVLPGRRRHRRPAAVLVAHPGAELYGSDRMLVESVAGLVAGGHRVVVALPVDGPLVAELEARGARVVRCRTPVLRKSALSPRGAVALVRDALAGLRSGWRLLRETGSGPVYVNTLTIPLWPLLAWVAGRPVTLHVHEAENSAPRLVRLVLALPALAARRVLVNSMYSRSVLSAALPRAAERSVLVHNGVAGPAELTPARTELSGPVRLVFVGRLSPRKGPQVAVAVLEELTRRGTDAHLKLVGSVFPGYEWFEAELRDQVARAGLAEHVEFLGFVPDVWGALAAADVVLIPSVLDEPFGNTAVEAVLAARPVVVSAGSGLQEAAAGYDSAQAVAPGDIAAWADAVQWVTAHWPDFVAGAQADGEEARRRHAPARYRAEVARLVTDSGVDRR